MGNLSNITVVGETEYNSENALGIRKDLLLLTSAMQKAMASITLEEKSAISMKWIGLRATNIVNYNLVWQILAVASIIIIVFAYWNHKLKKSQQEAYAANLAKSTFLANMSHEIRTPLNAIMGFSDAMLEDLGGPVTNPKHREYLTDIKNSGEHLSSVIKDILDLSKIVAGKWQLHEQKFNLDECMYQSIRMVLPKAKIKNIPITFNPEYKIDFFGDQHGIGRALINLLSNAVRITPENGSITCEITSTSNGNISINICDTGLGIPEERLEDVLKPFEQGHQGYEINEEGTGLGLPIVKYLAELHGGKFILTSKINTGTTATIILPKDRIRS